MKVLDEMYIRSGHVPTPSAAEGVGQGVIDAYDAYDLYGWGRPSNVVHSWCSAFMILNPLHRRCEPLWRMARCDVFGGITWGATYVSDPISMRHLSTFDHTRTPSKRLGKKNKKLKTT